ncbi:IS3 family transposase [Streptomyces sp. M10(2022)]
MAGPGGAEEGRGAAGGRDPVLHAGSRGAYGAPRIHAALRRAGRNVNGKRVERLMRVHHITGITRRRRRGLTRQARRAVFAADLIGRDFTAPRPGCAWSAR